MSEIDPILENYLLKMESRILEKASAIFAPILAWTILLGILGLLGAAIMMKVASLLGL